MITLPSMRLVERCKRRDCEGGAERYILIKKNTDTHLEGVRSKKNIKTHRCKLGAILRSCA